MVSARELGGYFHLAGNENQAAKFFEESATRARRINKKDAEAAALHGLSRSYQALDLPEEAAAIGQRLKYLEEDAGSDQS